MKTLVLSIFLLLNLNCLSQDSLLHLNLNHCIELALKNNPDVARKVISAKNAHINLAQLRDNLLPSLNTGITNGLKFGRSIDPLTNSYVNEKIEYANPYFSSSLLLFNGFAQQNTIRQYSLIHQAAVQEEQHSKNELILSVTLAFLEALTNQDLVTLAKARQQTTTRQLERLEVLNNYGAISPRTYFDFKGQYANDNILIINTINMLDNSKLKLVRLLNIPYKKNIILEQLETEEHKVDYQIDATQVYQIALNNFALIKAAELRKKSADMQIKALRSAYFPSVYFNSGFSSYSNLSRNSQNIPIAYFDQFGNNLSKYFTVSITIPLLNSFRTRNNVSLAKLTEQENTLIAESTKIQLQQLIEQAYFNMVASKERSKNLSEQVEAYRQSYNTAEVSFHAGVINSVEYLIAKNNLDKANTDQLINGYDYIVRKKILDFYFGNPIASY